MKQVVQNIRTGEVAVLDAPIPVVKAGHVLVRNIASVVSVGTERQMMEFAKKGLLGKALARPDLVRKVLDVARTEGPLEAYQQAMGRLGAPRPLGYSSAGEVVEVGPGVDEFRRAERVACAGSAYACHAEVVSVPQMLCAKIPEGLSLEEASFTTLGATALHSLRLADIQLGDHVAIIGLGLVGLLAVQVAKAWGCKVLGADLDQTKATLAVDLGADLAIALGQRDAVSAARSLFGALGADAVIIWASTTSNEPLELAAHLARVRGRVVVPGLVGLNVPRRLFYEKELDLKVSRAWGPGVYDPSYEEHGHDYPLPFVRWTGQRNMAAFLDLVAQGRVRLQPLITHRIPIEDAEFAYKVIQGETSKRHLGVLLTYGRPPVLERTVTLREGGAARPAPAGEASIGLIGAGTFARTTVLPILCKLPGVRLRGVATATGVSARHVGEKFGFDYCTTDSHAILQDPQINRVIIATRHNLHAKLVVEALRAGKHVFVEKPLALNEEELWEVVQACQEAGYRFQDAGWAGNPQGTDDGQPAAVGHPPMLMVGFNRRFSPTAVQAKAWLDQGSGPMVITCRVNAGFVASESWIQDPLEGGGRIIGEVCHFVDLIQFLTGARPVRVFAEEAESSGAFRSNDNIAITLRMSDGSVASIVYTARGDKGFPRERLEIFRDGAVCLIDNFRLVSYTRGGKTRRRRFWNADRGHAAQFAAFISPSSAEVPSEATVLEYVLVTLVTFSIVSSVRCGRPIEIGPPWEPTGMPQTP